MDENHLSVDVKTELPGSIQVEMSGKQLDIRF